MVDLLLNQKISPNHFHYDAEVIQARLLEMRGGLRNVYRKINSKEGSQCEIHNKGFRIF